MSKRVIVVGALGLAAAGCDVGDVASSAGSSGDSTSGSTVSSSGTGTGTGTGPSGSSSTGSGAGGSTGSSTLHVVGNHLVDNGATVRLIGWDRPGSEYACINNNAVFDGPMDLTALQSMQAWKGFNAIRLPLNETCWLGINGVPSEFSGTAYVDSITAFVSLARAQGIYVILDMHWNAPGTQVAKGQLPMADADHALVFWQQVADAFKGDLGVLFDLYNEPHLDSLPSGGFVAGANATTPWSCWLNGGCTIMPQSWEPQVGSYVTAGMQPMITAVRGTGAQNVIMAGGLNWANDLSGWTSNTPHDPTGNLAASGHVYYKPPNCSDSSCYPTLTALAPSVPIIAGEIGEFDCADGFVDNFMGWADTSGVSYLAWSWSLEPCGSPGPNYSSGPSLISDWTGTPTGYGQGYKSHLATLSQ